MTNHQIVQGGSSITQQLVKNVYLTPEVSWDRKFKELLIAYTLTNQRIIETKGILEKTETSLPLFFIQDATLRTWFFPRWGAVSVSTAGEVGAFTGTLWLRQAEARSLREGIVQEAERTRAVQGGLRPGGSSPLGAPRSAR